MTKYNTKTNYHITHRLVAYVLFINLFLQSCGGFQSQLVPEGNNQLTKKIELTNNPLINADKEFMTSDGYLIFFYEKDGELKANLKADAKQPKPNYEGLSVVIEEGVNLSCLTRLDPITQKNRIELNCSNRGQLRYVTIRTGGVLGGMKKTILKKGDEDEEKESDFNDYQELVKIAFKGDPGAQFQLGKRAYEVWHKQKNEEAAHEAREWLGKAAIQGHQEAVALLKEMNRVMLPKNELKLKKANKENTHV